MNVHIGAFKSYMNIHTGADDRTRFACLPLANIKVRLRQAVGGNAHPRCV